MYCIGGIKEEEGPLAIRIKMKPISSPRNEGVLEG